VASKSLGRNTKSVLGPFYPFALTPLCIWVESFESEISLIISSQNALVRQSKLRIINLLKKAAKEKNVRVNLAIPRYQRQEQSFLESANYSENSVIENLHMIEELPLGKLDNDSFRLLKVSNLQS
jgi:hypothetical protein